MGWTKRRERARPGKLVGAFSGSGHPKSRIDWRRVDALTDEDIRSAVGRDPDTRVLTVRELKESYRVPETVNVRQLRLGLRMSQAAFARKYGFSIDALQD